MRFERRAHPRRRRTIESTRAAHAVGSRVLLAFLISEPPKNMTLKITIYDDSDTAIDVTGEYTPPCKGSRNEYGVPMEPDYEDSMEILDAVDQDGTSRNLLPCEESRAMDALWESVAAHYDNSLG